MTILDLDQSGSAASIAPASAALSLCSQQAPCWFWLLSEETVVVAAAAVPRPPQPQRKTRLRQHRSGPSPVALSLMAALAKMGSLRSNSPTYVAADAEPLDDNVLMVGFFAASRPRAISHKVLDWHEVVNDNLDGLPVVINYCPLTGSAMLLEGSSQSPDPTFGVSGLLFNSDLILYDLETDSLWSQMQRESVNGARGTTYARSG